MKRIFVLLIAALLLSSCDTSTGITVKDPWARPALEGGNGAVYLVLQNHSATADELTGATSDIAESVEIHESKMEGNVMQMQHVMSVLIEGKASVEFSPGGYHIMLIGLKQELAVGSDFQVTLHFASHEDIVITVPVQESGADNSMNVH